MIESLEEAPTQREHSLDLAPIKAVTVLQVQPGDIVVLLSPQRISAEEAEALHKTMKGRLPDGVKVVLLDAGMDIKLLRPERAEQYFVEEGKE